MVDGALFVFIQIEFLKDEFVTLGNFARSKAPRQLRFNGMVFDRVSDGVDATVNCAFVVFRATEILLNGVLLIVRDVQRVVNEFGNAFIARSRNRHHRNAQQGFHFVNANGAPVVSDFVHHVKCQNHGLTQFKQLHREVQISLDIGRVHNVDDDMWIFF